MNLVLQYIWYIILLPSLPITGLIFIIIGLSLPKCEKDDEEKKRIEKSKSTLIIIGTILIIAFFVYIFFARIMDYLRSKNEIKKYCSDLKNRKYEYDIFSSKCGDYKFSEYDKSVMSKQDRNRAIADRYMEERRAREQAGLNYRRRLQYY